MTELRSFRPEPSGRDGAASGGPDAPLEGRTAEPARRGAFLRLALFLVLAGGALLLVLAVLVRRVQHVGLGEEIVHDDFGFRVVAVEPEHAFADGALRPKGRFLVVHLAIANHAKRVPFELDAWTPVLFDATGRVHEPDARAQAALVAERGAVAERRGALERGASTTKLVVYDVPRDARDLRLKLHWGAGPVNLLEDLVFGEKDIALGEALRSEAGPDASERPPESDAPAQR